MRTTDFRPAQWAAVAGALLCAIACADSEPTEAGPDLLGYRLKSVAGDEQHDLVRYRGRFLLILVFEPDCAWCARQAEAIDAVLRECPEAGAIGVGVNARRASLRRSAHRMALRWPAYEASPSFVRSLGGPPATPVTLIADAEGRYVEHSAGFRDAGSLLEALESRGACARDAS